MLAPVSLVLGLGLEHSCPWPREVLSSERLSLALALASDFFCVLGLGLGLEPCVLDSTSGTKHSKKFEKEKMNKKEKSTGCKKQTNKFDLKKSIQTLFLTSNAACFSDLIGFENLLNSLHDLKKLRSPIVQA